MNKRFFTFMTLISVLFVFHAKAQDHQEAKTLLGNAEPISVKDLGFFAAPGLGVTQMDGSTASLFYLRSGINVKDKFSAGAYFNVSLNHIMPQSETVPNTYMDFWTVGGFAEYTLLSKKLVHLTFPLYLGYGEVEMDGERGDIDLDEAYFFQIEPSALLELNLHKYVRLNLGAGYRFVSDMNYRNFNQSDISGWTGYAGLKIGLFR